MNADEKAVETAHVWDMIKNAVDRGNGAEAKRLADKHKVPNAIRLDLGVEFSSDPKKAPKLKIG